jgi:Zn ribbon nucleic-acid-binding protein
VILVTCPCCHGEKMLRLYEEDQVAHSLVLCCHCAGEGTVRAEVEEPRVETTLPQGWLKRVMARWA